MLTSFNIIETCLAGTLNLTFGIILSKLGPLPRAPLSTYPQIKLSSVIVVSSVTGVGYCAQRLNCISKVGGVGK
jgi:hypothetical protein